MTRLRPTSNSTWARPICLWNLDFSNVWMNRSTEQIIRAAVKPFFKVPRHTPVDPNWSQKNIHGVSRVWPCLVSWELWCYLKSIEHFSMSMDLQGKQATEPQSSGALSPKAQKVPERSSHHFSFCLLSSRKLLPDASHPCGMWQELCCSLQKFLETHPSYSNGC